MDAQEAIQLSEATDWAIHHYSADYRFTAADIAILHKQWLGSIYGWAGEFRQVNISKGGFAFAMAAQVPRLMHDLEQKVLATYTPCNFNDHDKVIEALTVTHCELVLIHPFREGNGRVSRLLSTLMALQAGLPLLDFTGIRGKTRQDYFMAVQASVGNNYEPMKKIFRAVVRRSLKN
ncbi:Protein adenylyltransferase NmFic [Methylophilaceae bacterium]|nr:Protein adenylyltransferase NmFic [Methylophilaceae bacterium]